MSFTSVVSSPVLPSFCHLMESSYPCLRPAVFIFDVVEQKNMKNHLFIFVWLICYVKYFPFFLFFKTLLHSRSISAPRWYISQAWFTDNFKKPFIRSKCNRKKKIDIIKSVNKRLIFPYTQVRLKGIVMEKVVVSVFRRKGQ